MKAEELYELAHDLSEEDELRNKYTYMAYHKFLDIKVMTINDTMNYETPINNYVQRYGKVLLFPNYVGNKIVNMTVKPMDEKKFLSIGKSKLPYNIGQINSNFVYGDTLFLVEGIADLAAIKLMYKGANVVSLKSNTIAKDMYKLFASVTNKIAIFPDDDKGGKAELFHMKRELKKLGADLFEISQFDDFKDSGEFLELIVEYKKAKDSTLLDRIELARTYYKNIMKFYENNHIST